MNYTFSVTLYDLDLDGDYWWDQTEIDCGADANDANSTPSDTDGDGVCDSLDYDIDGDGVSNDFDGMPYDANETADTDGDGIGDNTDWDLDGDGWSNIAEEVCGSDVNISWAKDYDGLLDIVAESVLNHTMSGTYLDYDGDNDGSDDSTEVDCGSDRRELAPAGLRPRRRWRMRRT